MSQQYGPIFLNEAQERAALEWAADDRLWTTQDTVAFNLRTFARVILKESMTLPEDEGTPAMERCARCGHPGDWHRHDDEACLSTHPQPCSLMGTLAWQQGAPRALFRCLGYDCDGPGFPAGTPESRCGCWDFIPKAEPAQTDAVRRS